MKALTFLLFAVILILAGCSKTDDFPEGNMTDNQLKSADSRTINFDVYEIYPDWVYYSELWCDGEIVDYLFEDVPGEEIKVHVTGHFIEDKLVWAVLHCKGTITSKVTGEKFKLVDQTKVKFDENLDLTSLNCHIHALGDKGSHIMNFIKLNLETQTFDPIKSICVGDVK